MSPSLARAGGRIRAFEVKFVVDEPTAAAVEARFAPLLRLDPHADAATGAYTITSIYSDTPDWDVYFRQGPHANRKFRVRQYGPDGAVFLERKAVRKSMVRKRRTAANGTQLDALIENSTDPACAWFVRQVAAAELRPVCRVRYARRALFGSCADGPMRVTFDREISGHLLSHWSFNGAATPRPLFNGVVVCEFKFRDAMPTPMKEAVSALRLEPRGVSKYRACISAFADVLDLPGAGHA